MRVQVERQAIVIIGVGTNINHEPRWQSPDLPAPTVTTSDTKEGASGWLLIDTDTPPMIETTTQDKPPYCIPSMADIAALPHNGYTCISTFSGCGGSSLGYKMAGFKVAWANEFIPAAQDVYRLNHPNTILDTRDIRTVTGAEILEAIGLRVGELDLFDGSPPCASFSTAGKREAGWGRVKDYSDTKQRTDDLFFEYTRLVREIQPKVFVAENVSGLVKGTAKGYFLDILREMKACGYRVEARLLDAQWLGVPQMRQRIIFIGVRNDLAGAPAFPKPLPYRYTVRDALPWVLKQRHGKGFGEEEWLDADDSPSQTVGSQSSSGNNINNGAYKVEVETDISRYAIGAYRDDRGAFGNGGDITNQPSPTVASVTHPTEKRKFSIAELKRICAFPDDFQLTGTYAQQWERLGRAVPPVMMSHIAATIRDEILCKIK